MNNAAMLSHKDVFRSEVDWYADASLRLPGRVLCAGTLAQCVRRWQRLQDEEKSSACLTYKNTAGDPALLRTEEIVALAAAPALRTV